jgi:hypothetical protein
MRLRSTVLAATTAFALATQVGLAQESTIVEFAGTEAAKDPANPLASLPFRGVIRCLGEGNPAPADQLVPPYCPAGTWTAARGRVLIMRWATSDPNTTGYMAYFMNFNLDSNTYSGPWWGTFVLDVPERGTWEGSFYCESTGQRPDGVGASASCRLTANGDGEFLRSHFMAEVNYEAMFLKPATVKGRYLRPNSDSSVPGVAAGPHPATVFGMDVRHLRRQ